ncbi:hypothetical protein AXF42_Ash016471 [Apostasia shenzhenica]|uniref:NAP1-related protein 2 n=1 Tax=Apostasia shenzhenica TaxID=1088818 RepID=A0A2I0AV82_9ASPA|nr:hypothetical protein AXF42_Ash016471 [Apostasia shenzhenica]
MRRRSEQTRDRVRVSHVMTAADKGKRSRVSEQGEGEDVADQIDGELVLSIEKLQEIQDELEKINEEASDKVLEVEQKYNEVRQPVYRKRNEIIQSIPDFWLTAFMSHPALGQLLNEEDQKILKHLTYLDVEESKDLKSGYTITFNFDTNPFFEDTKLSKTYTFFDDGTTKITGTSIQWKDGMGLANGSAQEKKGKKRSLFEERLVLLSFFFGLLAMLYQCQKLLFVCFFFGFDILCGTILLLLFILLACITLFAFDQLFLAQ